MPRVPELYRSFLDDVIEVCKTSHIKIQVRIVAVIGVTNLEGVKGKDRLVPRFKTWDEWATHKINISNIIWTTKTILDQ